MTKYLRGETRTEVKHKQESITTVGHDLIIYINKAPYWMVQVLNYTCKRSDPDLALDPEVCSHPVITCIPD